MPLLVFVFCYPSIYGTPATLLAQASYSLRHVFTMLFGLFASLQVCLKLESSIFDLNKARYIPKAKVSYEASIVNICNARLQNTLWRGKSVLSWYLLFSEQCWAIKRALRRRMMVCLVAVAQHGYGASYEEERFLRP